MLFNPLQDSLHKMMKVTIYLLVAVLISTQYRGVWSCAIDKVIDQKIKASVDAQGIWVWVDYL